MSETHQQSLLLSSGEESALASYKPVSRLAMLAVALALASPLGLVSPLLWAIPFAAVGVSLTALIVINLPQSAVIGRKAALAALVVACLFGAWGPARVFSRQLTLNRSALEFVNNWLDLVRTGKLEEAFDLHVERTSPARNPGLQFSMMQGGGIAMPQGEPQTPAEYFFGSPPYDKFVSMVKAGGLQHESVTAEPPAPGFDYVTLRFLVDNPDESGSKRIRIDITARRSQFQLEGESQWMIHEIDRVDL